ncbi:unnamed protein product [Lymnaea stagnalis]|uniref:Syntaxin-binding protein 4 n=1 Tax=Lymnaea stagnalis TaxID=6523 RepID=A0AAV2IDZ3_LYMST
MSVTLTLAESHSMKDVQLEELRLHHTEEDEDAREAELIEFHNTTQGLGLKICGGCSEDGKEEYGIFVKHVLPGGLAETTGELFDGDLILEVNGQSLQGVTYGRAVSMLRQASASNHVNMVITRDGDARREFAEYMTRFASNPSPYTVGDQTYGGPVTDSETEFLLKYGPYHKDVHPDLDISSDQQEFKYTESYRDHNGHISPSSSCASEVANHMGEPATGRPLSNGSGVSHSKETPSDHLDSLLSKKLSQDPGLKLHIDQLESALTNLGLHLTQSAQISLRQRLNIDHNGMVRFEEFVEAAKIVYQNDLGALKGRLTPQLQNDNNQNSKPSDDYVSAVKERDQLRAEVVALKEELRTRSQSGQNAEEQLLFIRKQAQTSIEECRSLKSKLHLAEQAQAKAQQTERDYEEVVAMLENEVSQLRLQMSKSDGVNMQKRLAVLVCQLKKAESGKKTYEVATDKLMRYVEHSLETLASLDAAARVPIVTENGNTKLNKKRALLLLSNEGREVIKTVRSLMESVPLPFGWEEAYTAEGVKYFINHLNQTTTWTHPVSCVEHQTSAKAIAPPAVGQEKQNPAQLLAHQNSGPVTLPQGSPTGRHQKQSPAAKGKAKSGHAKTDPLHSAVQLEHPGQAQTAS